jgi:circadian clock protein KaiB
MKPATASKPKGKRSRKDERWHLRLYIAGATPKSLDAVRNLKKICDTRVAKKYEAEVIDLLEHPQLAKVDQILAIPTLVRRLPPPLRKIVGDLSNIERVLVVLDLCRGDIS